MPLTLATGTYNKDNCSSLRLSVIPIKYRHIDGAMFYGNEVDVGNGIRQKIEEKVVTREELFLVSKVRI
jgi:diketogulonate reductase-like aldo/keto reductase